MTESGFLPEQTVCHIGAQRRLTEPCSIVIFGASGDLTARKLIPAFYHLCKEKQMPGAFRIIGFARREKSDDAWRAELRTALDKFSRTKPVDEEVWRVFAANLHYCTGDMTDAAAYEALEKKLTFLRRGAVAAESAFLSGDAAQPVWGSHRAAARRRIAAARPITAAGSGLWWKNRSDTTWRRPAC